MSGGVLGYPKFDIDEIARKVRDNAQSPLHHAFASHLEKVSLALEKLDKALDADISIDEADEEIRHIITPAIELDAATNLAYQALYALQDVLERDKPDFAEVGKRYGFIDLISKYQALVAECKEKNLPYPDKKLRTPVSDAEIRALIAECEKSIEIGF